MTHTTPRDPCDPRVTSLQGKAEPVSVRLHGAAHRIKHQLAGHQLYMYFQRGKTFSSNLSQNGGKLRFLQAMQS